MAFEFCPLFSGSSGNSVYVASSEARILVDAGKSCKRIVEALKALSIQPESIDAILVTHEHTDHISGIGVLSRKYDIPVYANPPTWHAIHEKLGDISRRNTRIFDTGKEFLIKNINVMPFSISHDAIDPVGFSFFSEGIKATCATDLGFVTNAILDIAEASDILLLEANHDPAMLQAGPYPFDLKRRIAGNLGHLSNADCAEALAKLAVRKVKQAVLGHLSKENNSKEVAMQTVVSILSEHGIERDIMKLSIAERDQVSSLYSF